jgi:tetratricopeptide (TPR) repeat protein
MLDIDSFWEYSDPALSETHFRAALAEAQGNERLELLTQIARTYSLRGQFAEAQALLDEVEKELSGAGARPRIRYLLERGRAYNSSGDKDTARPLFIQAWELGQSAGQTGLAVDAAHMIAITCSGTPEAITWNLRGLELARPSQDKKARALIPAMLNNTAWDLHERGEFAQALPLFAEAQVEWEKRGKLTQIQIARWSVARCLRSLGQCDEALTIQHALETEHQQAGTADGYVFEELAENLLALGRTAEARPYFQQAVEALSQDEWFVQNEVGRLARLKLLAV